jgi:hypothetical protein
MSENIEGIVRAVSKYNYERGSRGLMLEGMKWYNYYGTEVECNTVFHRAVNVGSPVQFVADERTIVSINPQVQTPALKPVVQRLPEPSDKTDVIIGLLTDIRELLKR